MTRPINLEEWKAARMAPLRTCQVHAQHVGPIVELEIEVTGEGKLKAGLTPKHARTLGRMLIVFAKQAERWNEYDDDEGA